MGILLFYLNRETGTERERKEKTTKITNSHNIYTSGVVCIVDTNLSDRAPQCKQHPATHWVQSLVVQSLILEVLHLYQLQVMGEDFQWPEILLQLLSLQTSPSVHTWNPLQILSHDTQCNKITNWKNSIELTKSSFIYFFVIYLMILFQ
jgi:hypothetical protein